MVRVSRERAVGKGGIGASFGIGASLSTPWSSRDIGPLVNFPPPPLFQGSYEPHPVSGACEYPPLAQYLAANTSWRRLRRQPFPVPNAGLAPPLPSPLLLLAYLPPTLCFSAKCRCLNGGTCVSYKYFSNIQRCSCPRKFQGEHCDIGMGIPALTGRRGHQRFGGRER